MFRRYRLIEDDGDDVPESPVPDQMAWLRDVIEPALYDKAAAIWELIKSSISITDNGHVAYRDPYLVLAKDRFRLYAYYGPNFQIGSTFVDLVRWVVDDGFNVPLPWDGRRFLRTLVRAGGSDLVAKSKMDLYVPDPVKR